MSERDQGRNFSREATEARLLFGAGLDAPVRNTPARPEGVIFSASATTFADTMIEDAFKANEPQLVLDAFLDVEQRTANERLRELVANNPNAALLRMGPEDPQQLHDIAALSSWARQTTDPSNR